MTRLVALLLALLLPLQFAWGTAAAYCQHETGAQAARHVGHHAHEHQAGQADQAAKKPAAAKLAVDNDCTACHATCSALAFEAPACIEPLAPAGRPALAPVDTPTSAPARAPDRPQWRRLA